MILKIAIPVNGNNTADTLNSSDSIIVYLLENSKIISREKTSIRSLDTEMLVDIMRKLRINLLIAFKLSERIQKILNTNKIGAICCDFTDADLVIKNYMEKVWFSELK
jgi:predicted Fe-Mo cluster-binding NifX family protein